MEKLKYPSRNQKSTDVFVDVFKIVFIETIEMSYLHFDPKYTSKEPKLLENFS